MKISKFTLILLFINSLSADYLMTLTMTDTNKDYTFSRCIKSSFTSDSSLYYVKSYDNTTYLKYFEDIKDYRINSGYYLDDDGLCVKWNGSILDFEIDNTLSFTADNLSYLGLSDYDLNNLMALSGLLISSLFMYGLFRFV